MIFEPKDIKKHLSLKGRIVVTGKHANLILKTSGLKVYKGFLTIVNTVKEKASEVAAVTTDIVNKVGEKILPDEEVIRAKTEEERKKERSKINTQRYELSKLKREMEKDDEYKIGTKNCYLKEVENEIRRLDKKRMNVSSQGLSIYSLSKLATSNIKNKLKNKWKNYREQKKIESAKEKLIENLEKIQKLQQEEKELLEKNNEIKNNMITEVIEIRKPSELEKTEIKKSSNFKRALTAMTLITGIAISSIIVSNISDKNIDNKSINSTVEDTNASNFEQKEECSLKLDDYVTLKNGTNIYQTSTLTGNRGIIGTNEYNKDTVFKINAITYVDENNIETMFNLVEKSEHEKKVIKEQHQKYIENNTNIKVKNFHITPCNEFGIPISDNESIDLGGWSEFNKFNVQKFNNKNIIMDTYKKLGGKIL